MLHAACRANLRGRLEPAHLAEATAVPGGLVLQHIYERRPSCDVNRLRHTRPSEPGHAQVLHVYRLVVADDHGGCLVVEVGTLVRDLSMEPGHLGPGLLPVLATFLRARICLLRPAELLLGPAQKPRSADLGAVRQDGDAVRPRSIPTSPSASQKRCASAAGSAWMTNEAKYRPAASLITPWPSPGRSTRSRACPLPGCAKCPDPRRHPWQAKPPWLGTPLRRMGGRAPIGVLRQDIKQQNWPPSLAHVRPSSPPA